MELKNIFIIIICLVQPSLYGQRSHYIIEGNEALLDSAYFKSDSLYRMAEHIEEGSDISYNRGLAQAGIGNINEARAQWEAAASADSTLKDLCGYNRATSYLEAGELKQAIDGYKAVLRSNPGDSWAAHNLSLAQLALRQAQQQDNASENSNPQNADENPENRKNQNSSEGGENSDHEDSTQGDDASDADENDSSEESEDPSASSATDSVSESRESGDSLSRAETQATLQALNEKELRQLLEIIQNEDEKIQGRLRNRASDAPRSRKDW